MKKITIDISLAAKLGSLVVHTEEMLSPTGHKFDQMAAITLLNDPAVQTFLDILRVQHLLPIKR